MQPPVWYTFCDDGVPPALDFEAVAVPAFLERSAMQHGDVTTLFFVSRNAPKTFRRELRDREIAAASERPRIP